MNNDKHQNKIKKSMACLAILTILSLTSVHADEGPRDGAKGLGILSAAQDWLCTSFSIACPGHL